MADGCSQLRELVGEGVFPADGAKPQRVNEVLLPVGHRPTAGQPPAEDRS